MAKPTKKKPAAKKKAAPAKKKPVAKAKAKAKPAAKKPAAKKPAAKKPAAKKPTAMAKPPAPKHDPTREEVGGRDAIHVELGAKLAAMRGDEVQERAAIASAIDAFMQLAIAEGLPANASAYSAQCPEFFWEGSGMNPPVYARVPDATHDEIGRWFQLIVEGVRAYDARVGATA
jgi:hypothetical protein